MGVLPRRSKIVGGEILYRGRDLTKLDPDEWRKMRGKNFAMVVQDPRASLDPVFTVGNQLQEVCTGDDAKTRIIETLRQLSITRPEEVYRSYPHQLSGGMNQRVVIAMAVLPEPELLIADEPTTALDVTVQAQILALLKQVQQRRKMALIIISHDLAVIASVASHILILYGGRAMEFGPVREIFSNPKHPYTEALLASIPRLDGDRSELAMIPGSPVDGRTQYAGCPFADRCKYAMAVCREQFPDRTEHGPNHWAACWHTAKETVGAAT
jgi:oligopeptide/dipeptide ABC transporter ATP-binding protein